MDLVIDAFKSFIPVITLIIGSALTYIYGVKSKQSEAALRNKEEQYSKLLVRLQGFVGQTANAHTKKDFFEEQYKSWLYSSDEVVVAINNMVALVIASKGNDPDPEEGRKAIGSIVAAMRKDLYGKTKLGYEAFRYTDVIGRR
ncbi:hypothetical protein JGK43_000993 [Edwardsiella piscicida]|nr:hypothetical protein [Edwardsiella piscicida]ELM3727428.1 hypothetical protein [Edwardsiella piscicida]ELV7536509.1 hypothetical protein [Edwardsiella piscicida]